MASSTVRSGDRDAADRGDPHLDRLREDDAHPGQLRHRPPSARPARPASRRAATAHHGRPRPVRWPPGRAPGARYPAAAPRSASAPSPPAERGRCRCPASCSARCSGEANLGCPINCQADLFESIEASCEADISAEGGLFCDEDFHPRPGGPRRLPRSPHLNRRQRCEPVGNRLGGASSLPFSMKRKNYSGLTNLPLRSGPSTEFCRPDEPQL